MDYEEEQRNELEALESIYPDCFSVLTVAPPAFTITLTSDIGDDSNQDVQVTLKFTYVEKYPDEPPLFEVVGQENLMDEDVADITRLLEEQATENLGMAMIFTFASAVQERLNELVDQMKVVKEEDLQRQQREAEEAEKVTFHGTPVTIENFLSWKAKFDQERLEMRKKKQLREEEQIGKSKLSGKQLFETDRNLDTSDMQFLEEGDNVEVDESLFQDMEDLDIDEDDDEDDDPTFNPADLDSDEN
ncbi:RWD domain-containing protein 1 [Lethenteron reissneri]|uniref:RWD domain-containing protein 1 n=1 Tax=Lethenteron reissneri TaxID=7753 RepID=UPI002AB6D539|nr:RWD domain-containing protein 1 [Lethenteron reissneri]